MIENGFYIITTGFYYEVHRKNTSNTLKLMHTPTIDEILKWEKEVC